MNKANLAVIENLEDKEIYGPGHIAKFAVDEGLLDPKLANNLRRNSLFKWSKSFGQPDGRRPYPQQGEIPAWYGGRYKRAAGVPGYEDWEPTTQEC